MPELAVPVVAPALHMPLRGPGAAELPDLAQGDLHDVVWARGQSFATVRCPEGGS